MWFLEERTWDCDFFQRKMGRILWQSDGNGFPALVRLVAAAKAQSYEHLMGRVSSGDAELTKECEDAGFRIYGTLVTFVRERFPAFTGECIRKEQMMQAHELGDMNAWAAPLFRSSYMYKDPFFPAHKVDELHELWLKNLEEDSNAVILVTRNESASVNGFCTLRETPSHYEIDLFGIHPEAQGKGFSKILLQLAFNYIGSKSSTKGIFVKTQGENLSAANAYTRSGFSFQKNELTFCLSLKKEG